jgi:phytoene dehydrogenase-like protein
MKTDAIVIGGGVAGLAAGALLAKQGKRVTVLEKGNQPGGRAYTYEDKGFTLNYGPHAMYRPNTGVLGDVLRRLERPLIKNGFPDPEKAYWAIGERFGYIGAKPQQVLTTALFPVKSRLQVMKLMAAIKFAKPEQLGDQTMRQWVERLTKDELVRRFALALTTVNTYTRPAGDLSAAFVLRQFQRNLFAKDYVGYMSGGWRTMYDTFMDVIEAHGGSVVCGARVESIEVMDTRAVGAATPDARYEADVFVCTLPPEQAGSIAGAGSVLASELAQWAGFDDVRALCIDLGFSRRVRKDLTFVFDVDHDLYFSLHSEVTPDLAPKGSQMLHAMAYLSSEEADDEQKIAGRKTELQAGLDRYFAGWREATVVERTLSDGVVTPVRRTPEQDGRRMPLRSSTASNLYFAGDGRDLPYNLSEVSLASAMEVADAVGATPAAQRAAEPIVAV